MGGQFVLLQRKCKARPQSSKSSDAIRVDLTPLSPPSLDQAPQMPAMDGRFGRLGARYFGCTDVRRTWSQESILTLLAPIPTNICAADRVRCEECASAIRGCAWRLLGLVEWGAGEALRS